MTKYLIPETVYPIGLDSDQTLYLVYNTTESLLAVDNEPWSETIEIEAVEAGRPEIWPENGFGTIGGELFYYDAVERNQDSRIFRLKKCIRNLGGERTAYNSTVGGSVICPRNTTVVRGMVVAQHHNQLVDAIYQIERFVGYNYDPNVDTLDYRIRCLKDVPICLDDVCVTIENFSVTVTEDSACVGVNLEYEIDINEAFDQFILDFGDGESTSSELSGTHVYAPGAKVDPVLIVSNARCQIVQTPPDRVFLTMPEPTPVVPFELSLPECPPFPNLSVIECTINPPDLHLPPILAPCISITPTRIPSITLLIDALRNLPSVINFGPLNMPSFISANIPSIINVETPNIPSFIAVETPNIPSIITILPINIPSIITVNMLPLPSIITITPITLPSMITITPITLPSMITMQSPNIPTMINMQAPNIPTMINMQAPNIPTLIDIAPVVIPTMISIPSPNIPSVINIPSPDIPTLIEVNVPESWPLIEVNVPASWPPIPVSPVTGSITCTVNVTCGGSSMIPLHANSGFNAFGKGGKFSERDAIVPTVDLGNIGIPSEIKVIAPNMPKAITLQHNLPNRIEVSNPNIPEKIELYFKEPLPNQIEVNLKNTFPKTIELVPKNIPESISLSLDVPSMIQLTSSLPEFIKLAVPDNLPSYISIDASGIPETIKVVGIPETISLIHTIPSEIFLTKPDDFKVDLVQSAPLDVNVNVQMNLARLVGATEDDSQQCVMIVPCKR